MISKTYLSLCKEGAAIIIDNCQLDIFGGFAPNSDSAQILSKSLGNRTVLSGSVSRGKHDPTQSLQMIERPLMTPDELKTLPKGHFIVAKTGVNPMKVILRLFFKWGISLDKIYELKDKGSRKVQYADKAELEAEIIRHFGVQNHRPPTSERNSTLDGGQTNCPINLPADMDPHDIDQDIEIRI